LKGHRCVGPCAPPIDTNVPISTDAIMWSKAESWPSGKIPVADDVVEIKPGVYMIFDLAESPILKQL
jgi:hypothetical protein